MALATSTILGLVSAGMSAAGYISQGQAENKQQLFQERVASQQANSERQIASDQERDYRKDQASKIAQIRASLGASGTDISTGTPLLSFGDFSSETERNALRIRSGGDIRSKRLDERADFYKSSGISSATRGYTRAGSSLLSGIGSGLDKKNWTGG